jgi:hypothetical protein
MNRFCFIASCTPDLGQRVLQKYELDDQFHRDGNISEIIPERIKICLIFSPTHVLEPEVPLENIAPFIETA